jgi:hypothetical protein
MVQMIVCHVSLLEFQIVDYHISVLIAKYKTFFRDVVLFPSFFADKLFMDCNAPRSLTQKISQAFVDAYVSCNMRQVQGHSSILFALPLNGGSHMMLAVSNLPRYIIKLCVL